jgi:hypothetical protein
MQCPWPEVGRGQGLADDVGFADPGALDVRKDDGDGVAGGLEVSDEGVNVGGGLVGGGPVVVGELDGWVVSCGSFGDEEGCGLARICMATSR